MFAQIARLGRSAEHSSPHENHVLEEINKVSGILASTELCGKLYLRPNGIFLPIYTTLYCILPIHNLVRETEG